MTAQPAAKMTGRTHFLTATQEVLRPVYTQAVLHDNPRSGSHQETIFNKADVFLCDLKYSESSKYYEIKIVFPAFPSHDQFEDFL